MKFRPIFSILCTLVVAASAQHEEGLLRSGPIPEMSAFSEKGEPVKIRELCLGKWTVLSGGCLTCPQFHRGYREIEAAKTDYESKGVQFFFFYKSLRHPELGGYVEAQNLEERMLQLAEAKKKLATTIPWLADTFENEMRDGLGAGANSVYLISPDGKIVFAQSRIEVTSFRQALDAHIGSVENPTTSAELDLPMPQRPPRVLNEDSAVTVHRPDGLVILKSTALQPDKTYYVKLRAEAEPQLLETGKGRLFLGFYPDPILGAHWNNLADPLKYELTFDEGVTAEPAVAQAAQGEGDQDTKPRQFWVTINGDGKLNSATLSMSYVACTDTMCLPSKRSYRIDFEVDDSGSRTFGFNRGGKGRQKGKGRR